MKENLKFKLTNKLSSFNRLNICCKIVCIVFLLIACDQNSQKNLRDPDQSSWYRPAEQPVFTADMGNNHDPVFFVDYDLEYPYHLIISHEKSAAHLWRTKSFSWDSKDWELVSDLYIIDNHYEYDDGVKVDGTYYIYEAGSVYTYTGALEEANGNWEKSGTFPSDQCDDIGVFYEDGVFHIFGEYGNFPSGPDGTSLSHFTSATGLGDWELVNAKAVDPNAEGGHEYGVGDATIVKIDGTYYLYCDRETEDLPYRITAWKSKDINQPFEFIGLAIEPRSDRESDWDNHRIQDGDIGYVEELSKYVMFCNMKDIDGNPGPPQDKLFESNHLKGNETRVIGVFYSEETVK